MKESKVHPKDMGERNGNKVLQILFIYVYLSCSAEKYGKAYYSSEVSKVEQV